MKLSHSLALRQKDILEDLNLRYSTYITQNKDILNLNNIKIDTVHYKDIT